MFVVIKDGIGCFVDATTFLDKACSGKMSCEYRVPGDDLYATKPCPKGLQPYLELEFECIQG